MRRRDFFKTVGAVFAVACVPFIKAHQALTPRGRNLLVGEGQPYPAIGYAYNDASPGDTIVVILPGSNYATDPDAWQVAGIPDEGMK